jgi:hypothetical protein
MVSRVPVTLTRGAWIEMIYYTDTDDPPLPVVVTAFRKNAPREAEG